MAEEEEIVVQDSVPNVHETIIAHIGKDVPISIAYIIHQDFLVQKTAIAT